MAIFTDLPVATTVNPLDELIVDNGTLTQRASIDAINAATKSAGVASVDVASPYNPNGTLASVDYDLPITILPDGRLSPEHVSVRNLKATDVAVAIRLPNNFPLFDTPAIRLSVMAITSSITNNKTPYYVIVYPPLGYLFDGGWASWTLPVAAAWTPALLNFVYSKDTNIVSVF